jgi:hypothetical protein
VRPGPALAPVAGLERAPRVQALGRVELALVRRLPVEHWLAVQPLNSYRIDLLAVRALEEATGRASCRPVPVAPAASEDPGPSAASEDPVVSQDLEASEASEDPVVSQDLEASAASEDPVVSQDLGASAASEDLEASEASEDPGASEAIAPVG